MSVTLRQIRSPDQRIDLSGLLPGRLCGMAVADIGRLPLYLGRRRYPLAELFSVELADGEADTLVVVPGNGHIDHIGTALDGGHIRVEGDAGDFTGSAMRGGSIAVRGNIRDQGGAGMRAGMLTIGGDAGDRLGAPNAGETRGQQGGVIHVRGSVGACAGERMRRGLLLIEGDAGARAAYRMIAGTLYVAGQVGELAGYGMRRGTLLTHRPPRSLPGTMADNGEQHLPFLPLLLKDLAAHVGDERHLLAAQEPRAQRYLGDLANDGRGEILVLR